MKTPELAVAAVVYNDVIVFNEILSVYYNTLPVYNDKISSPVYNNNAGIYNDILPIYNNILPVCNDKIKLSVNTNNDRFISPVYKDVSPARELKELTFVCRFEQSKKRRKKKWSRRLRAILRLTP